MKQVELRDEKISVLKAGLTQTASQRTDCGKTLVQEVSRWNAPDYLLVAGGAAVILAGVFLPQTPETKALVIGTGIGLSAAGTIRLAFQF